MLAVSGFEEDREIKKERDKKTSLDIVPNSPKTEKKIGEGHCDKLLTRCAFSTPYVRDIRCALGVVHEAHPLAHVVRGQRI